MEERVRVANSSWIAIEPPRNEAVYVDASGQRATPEDAAADAPPSFRESRFDVILRRQRMRPPEGGGLKVTDLPSRFLNLPDHFEFAGWGSVTRLKLDAEDRERGEELLRNSRQEKYMGQFVASGLAGNDILGGVFYTLPAVMTVSGVYSPISLFIAVLTLFLWRPIMEELGSALPISGALYAYLLNVSTKKLALIGAILLLLDFASTSVISAATATSYITNEVHLPFPTFLCTAGIILIFTAVSLTGIKASVRVAFVVLVFHLSTMSVLIIASIVEWVRVGNSQLQDNWNRGQAPSSAAILRQVFNGFVLGMLGLTGFECTSSHFMSDLDHDHDDDGGPRPSKRPRSSLFLPDSDDDIDVGASHNATAPAPAQDINAIFDDAENDETLAPPLDLDALRRESDARNAKNIQPIAPSTLHQILPSSSPSREAGATQTKSGAGKSSAGSTSKTAEGGSQKRKNFKLDEASLLGPNGFPQLIKDTQNFTPKGKGHEASDLGRLLQIYQFWTHRLYPKTQFKGTVERVEKLCHSRRMHIALSVWRDEAHGLVNGHAVDISSDEEGQSDAKFADDAQETNNDNATLLPSSRAVSPSASSPTPSRPPSSAFEHVSPDIDIDIDAFIREEGDRVMAQPTQVPTAKASNRKQGSGSLESIDQDEAMWDEPMGSDMAVQLSAPNNPKVVIPERPSDNDDEEMWDIVRELEKDPPPPPPSATASAEPAAAPPATEEEDDWDQMYL